MRPGNGGVCAPDTAGKTPSISSKINFNGRRNTVALLLLDQLNGQTLSFFVRWQPLKNPWSTHLPTSMSKEGCGKFLTQRRKGLFLAKETKATPWGNFNAKTQGSKSRNQGLSQFNPCVLRVFVVKAWVWSWYLEIGIWSFVVGNWFSPRIFPVRSLRPLCLCGEGVGSEARTNHQIQTILYDSLQF